MITLNATALAEMAKMGTQMVQLLRLDLGGADVFYLSTHPVSAAMSFDGRQYWPLVEEIPPLPFPVGYKKQDVKIKLLDVGGSDLPVAARKLFTGLRNTGRLFTQARVDVVYLFPHLAAGSNRIGDWGPNDTSGAPNNEQPHWTGRVITEPVISNGRCVLSVQHGPVDLTQRAYRKFRGACEASFADGHQCPYSTLNGYGLPRATVAGTADNVAGLVVTDAGPNFGLLAIDDVAVMRESGGGLAVGEITNVNPGANQFTVDQWRFGTPSTGWQYIAGTPFADCDYLVPSCQARGMYGPSQNMPGWKLNKVKRRWFIGLGPIARTSFEVVLKRGLFNRVTKRSDTTPVGNQSIQGSMVPVIIGYARLEGMQVIAYGNDGRFVYAYCVVGEGRCKNIHWARLDGAVPDNDDPKDPAYRDPLVLIGFDLPNGGNDADAVTAGEITEQQRLECLGAREAIAWVGSREVLDTYQNVPYLFSDQHGMGPSPSHVSAVYMRTEPEAVTDNPTLMAIVQGLACRRPGLSPTFSPTVADVAYEFMLNTTWGAKVPAGDLNGPSFTALSLLASLPVATTTAPLLSDINGTVAFGPNDLLTDPPVNHRRWIFSALPLAEEYVGSDINITSPGKVQTRRIVFIDVQRPGLPDDNVLNASMRGGPFTLKPQDVGRIGAWIFVDREWGGGSGPPVVHSDDFNRPDSDSLGAPWVESETGPTACRIFSNQLRLTNDPALYGLALYNQTFPTDHSSRATYKGFAPGSTFGKTGFIVRGSGTAAAFTGYVLIVETGGAVQRLALYKYTGGPLTTIGVSSIATAAVTVTADQEVKLEALGVDIKGYVNGIERISAVDAGITSGQPGHLAPAVYYELQNYLDDFNRATSQTMGAPWSEQENNSAVFQIPITGQMRCRSTTTQRGVAIYDQPVASDHYAEAEFFFDTTGGFSGPAGRIQAGSTHSNATFIAIMVDLGATKEVEMVKYSAASVETANRQVLTQQDPYTIVPGDVLRLTLVGNTYKVFLNTVEFLTFTDPSPLSGGKAGMHAPTVSGFTVSIDWKNFKCGDVSPPPSGAPSGHLWDNWTGEGQTAVGIPAAGDTFTIDGSRAGGVPQFGPAQGEIAKDVEVGEALEDILKNAFATFTQRQGLAVFSRTEKDLAQVNLLPTITDKGTAPNVVIEGGSSSIVFEPYKPDKLVNEIEVQYLDEATGKTELIVVKNQAAQDYLRTKHGAASKYILKAKLSLNLCGRLEWAARLGGLYLRHYGARPGIHYNGRVKFTTALQTAIAWVPVEDVFAVDSDELPYWIDYLRIDSMQEDFNKGFMRVEAVPYVHADYEDPLNGFEIEIPIGAPVDPANPLPVSIRRIDSVFERLITDSRGTVHSELTVTYTLPE